MNNNYGLCDVCQTPLQADTGRVNEFYPNTATPTGRTKFVVNFLYCPQCRKKILVDDTFDGQWHD